MAKQKTTCRFWLRIDRANQDGTCPIHLIYQVKGSRKYYAVPDTLLHPMNWDNKEQKAITVPAKKAKSLNPSFDTSLLLYSNEVNEINDRLSRLLIDIQSHENYFNDRNEPFDGQMIIDRLRREKEPQIKAREHSDRVAAFIRRFAEETTAKHHKAGTIKVYTGLANHLEAYEKIKGRHVTFDSLDIVTLKSFHGFLEEDRVIDGKVIKGMIDITSAKQMSTLKTLINYARKDYKIKVNPDYKDYSIPRNDSNLEVIALEYDEFLKIYNLELPMNSGLDEARDVFCFSCATGLRYSDLLELKREHIRGDVIIKTAEKTGQLLQVPLNPFSAAILEKYKERERPLPVSTNQHTNRQIKVIGKLAGIDTPIATTRKKAGQKITITRPKFEELTCHVGRKSFITLSLEKGMQPQVVMSLSGHTTWRAFKRYVEVTAKHKQADMAKAWGKVNPLKKAE